MRKNNNKVNSIEAECIVTGDWCYMINKSVY